jgi:hypothetical protein
MTLVSYRWITRLIVLLALAAEVAVVYSIDPTRKEYVGQAIFYGVLFFALSGIFNLTLLAIRRKLLGEEAALATAGLSFRQAVLLSVLACGMLFLQSLRMLWWWDALLVVAGIFLIELYFLSRS